MAKKETKTKKNDKGTTSGEQMPLIDVGPKGMEKIRPFVKECAKQQVIRAKAWEKIVEAKDNIRELVHKEGLKPSPKGKIVFKCGSQEVEVTPKKDEVKVSEAKEE